MKKTAITLRDIILGGQDGLVNVLGLSLGLFAAHASVRVIVVAGLAAGCSEAVSMGAVAYTSSRADKEKLNHTKSQLIFSSLIVTVSAFLGSLAPLIPFIFFPEAISVATAIFIAAVILFILGVFIAKTREEDWFRGGFEIVFIGLVSAFAGFLIGLVLKV